MIRLSALTLPLLALGCTALGPSPAARSQAEKLAYAPAGKAMSCVPLRSIRETRVLDDSTVDFVLVSGERVRNSLPVGCGGLRSGDGITYSTSLSQLCKVDIVTVLDRAGGLQRGASCGLGDFQPVQPVDR